MHVRTRLLAATASLPLLLWLTGCGHKKAPLAPIPKPQVAAPMPTADLHADPTAIERGQSSTLTWTTTNAVSATLNGARVNLNGSQQVSPTESTDYELVATNSDGQSSNASVRVTVAQPPPPQQAPPPPQVKTIEEQFNENIHDAFFDYDKWNIRADAQQALVGDADWLKQHPNVNFIIEGHCDARGSAEYNMGLGDRRANAARKYLVALGVDASRIRTISYGKERPFCTEATSECYQMNRRAHLTMQPSGGGQ